MKKELEYFYIDNSYGWNQDWFKEFWMKIGGCAAVTACETFVYLKKYKNRENVYPYSVDVVDREEYFDFTNTIKTYLKPRITGIDKLSIYVDGINKYFSDIGENIIQISAFEGYRNFNEAKDILKKQIDNGFVVPMLILKHKNPLVKNYVWHWFLITGYEEIDNDLNVKLVTYGNYEWMKLSTLWDTGYDKKGGLIIYSI